MKAIRNWINTSSMRFTFLGGCISVAGLANAYNALHTFHSNGASTRFLIISCIGLAIMLFGMFYERHCDMKAYRGRGSDEEEYY